VLRGEGDTGNGADATPGAAHPPMLFRELEAGDGDQHPLMRCVVLIHHA
jgi:hypothetical protein